MKYVPSEGYGIIVYIIPIIWLHECGHILACNIFGLKVTNVLLLGVHPGIEHNWSSNDLINILVGACGGFLVVLIILPVYWFFRRNLDYRTWIEIMILYQLFNGVVEGLMHDVYMNNLQINLLFLIISIVISFYYYSRALNEI